MYNLAMREDRISRTQQDTRRLLGLREFPQKTEQQRRALLGSDMRANALNSIDTTTHPRRKRDVKKGTVLEVVEKNLVAEAMLKRSPVIYIGSGTDVEYPLALGARNVVLVDPIFAEPEAVMAVKNRLANIIQTQPNESNSGVFQFDFDYGNGMERAEVSLVAKPYHHESEPGDYEIPPGTGGILLYASQGPSYAVQLEKGVCNKITADGFILDEYILNRRNQESGASESMELGTP